VVIVAGQGGVVIEPARLIFGLHAAEIVARLEDDHAYLQLIHAGYAPHVAAIHADDAVGAVIDGFAKLAVGIYKRAGAINAAGIVIAGGGIGPSQHGAENRD